VGFLSLFNIASCIHVYNRDTATRCLITIRIAVVLVPQVAAAAETKAVGKSPVLVEVAVRARAADAAVGKAKVTQRKLKVFSLFQSMNRNQSTNMETVAATISNPRAYPGKNTTASSRALSKSWSMEIEAANILLSKCQGTDIQAAGVPFNSTQVTETEATNPLLGKSQGMNIQAASVLLSSSRSTVIEAASPLPSVLGSYTDEINLVSLLLARDQILNMENLLTMAPAHTCLQCVFRKRRTAHTGLRSVFRKRRTGHQPRHPILPLLSTLPALLKPI
jgi:hypothetical protein